MNSKKYEAMYSKVESLLDDTVSSLRGQVKEVLSNDALIDDAILTFAREPDLCRAAFGDEFVQNLLLLNAVAESVSLLDDLTHFSAKSLKEEEPKAQDIQVKMEDVLRFPTEINIDPFERPDEDTH